MPRVAAANRGGVTDGAESGYCSEPWLVTGLYHSDLVLLLVVVKGMEEGKEASQSDEALGTTSWRLARSGSVPKYLTVDGWAAVPTAEVK